MRSEEESVEVSGVLEHRGLRKDLSNTLERSVAADLSMCAWDSLTQLPEAQGSQGWT